MFMGPASLARLDVDDREGRVVDAQRLGLAGGLEVGERREEELLIHREGREEGDLGAAHHEVLGVQAQQQRALGGRVCPGMGR